MTETGYDSAGPFGTTEAIQAARLPRVVMLCLANGVEKVFVYRESGSTPSMHACSGILRNDFSRKPSWYTLRTMIRQLQGVSGGARRMPHPDQNVWLLEWDTGGKPLLTAWTLDGKARLGIDLGGCKVTDSFGGLRPLPSTAEVEITPYPQYFRDFSSTEALEKLRAEHQRQEAARIARLEKIASLRKYLFDFGSLEHVGAATWKGIGRITFRCSILRHGMRNEAMDSTNRRCRMTTSRGWGIRNWIAMALECGTRYFGSALHPDNTICR